jgi:nucleoid DNA-binding protein
MAPPTDDRTVKKSLRGLEILDYPVVVEKLAEQQKLSEIKVRAVVRGLVGLVAEGLKTGKAVRIGGLGVLRIRDTKAPSALPLEDKPRAAKKRVVLSPAKQFNVAVDLDEGR